MKRSVVKDVKTAIMLLPVVLVISYLTRPDEAGLIFIILGVMVGYAMIDLPPLWLRRSPFGRWLRR